MRIHLLSLVVVVSAILGFASVSLAVTQDLQISWTASAPNPATGYRVEKETTPGVFAQVGGNLSATTLTYTDVNQTFGTTFCYRVIGLGSAGNSAPSAKVCSATAGVASTPGSVTVKTVITP